MNDEYITGTGQRLIYVHKETPDCKKYGCAIHAPSDHSMKNFPTHWRDDGRKMERICEHGIGHPDPDHLNWVKRTYGEARMMMEEVHGCDGCCAH